MLDEKYLDALFSSFSAKLESLNAGIPSVTLLAEESHDPYRVLFSTLISLRTKDEVTLAASRRLFGKAPDIRTLAKLDASEIAEIIKPAGFYKRKGEQIKKTAETIMEKYDGCVPRDMDALLSLPGVGIKTASLVLGLGYGIEAICVDCHVHQIVNRLGWVETETAEETEKRLREILPRRFWIPLNDLLVRYGQKICTPVSPFCSLCPESGRCPRKGVQRTR